MKPESDTQMAWESAAPEAPGTPALQPSSTTLALTLALLAAPLAVLHFLPFSHRFEGLPAYTLAYTPLELVAIVVALASFTLIWSVPTRALAPPIQVLSIAFGAIGLLDVAHVLSYPGMPDFVTPNDANKSICFGLASRLLSGFAFVYAAMLMRWPRLPSVPRLPLLAGITLVVAAVFWAVLVNPDLLPAMWTQGKAPATAKIAAEHLVIALHTAAALLLLGGGTMQGLARLLFAAACITVLSELLLALYSNVTDISNFIRHLYKAAAYWLIYRAIVSTTIQKPYRELETAQRKLAETARRYWTLAEQGSDWYWEQDPDLRFTYVSPGLRAAVGVEPDEHYGRTRWELNIDRETDDRWAAHRAILASRRPFDNFVYRRAGPDGDERYMSISGRPMFDEDGNFQGYLGIGKDVTAEERLRAMLDTENRVFELLANARPLYDVLATLCRSAEAMLSDSIAAVMLADPDGKHLRLGAAPSLPARLLETTGCVPVRIDSTPCARAFFLKQTIFATDLEHDPLCIEANAQLLSAGVKTVWSTPIMNGDDPVGTLNVYFRGTRRPTDKIVDLLHGLSRIAAIAIQRTRLEEHHRLSTRALETSNDGVLITDKENRILWSNPAFSRITGYAAHEVVGKNPRILSSGLQDAAFYDQMWKRLTDNGNWQGELWDRRRDGRLYCEHLSLSVMKNADGNVTNYLAVFSDVTPQKLVRQRLELRHEVTQLLAQEAPVLETMPRVLETIGRTLRWDFAGFWSPRGTADALTCQANWAVPGPGLLEFVDSTRRLALPSHVSIVGQVWQHHETIFIHDFTGNPADPRQRMAARSGLSEVLCVPVMYQGKIQGVLEFYSCPTDRPEHDVATIIASLADQLGAHIEKERIGTELQKNEAEMRLILDNAPASIVHWTVDLHGIFANRIFLERYRVPGEAFPGMHMRDIFGESRFAERVQQLKSVLACESIRFTTSHRTAQGQLLTLDVTYVPELGRNGEVRGIYSFATDVTAKADAEQARARLAAIVENANEAIISCNLEGTITSWNKGAESMFGYTADEAIGKPISFNLEPGARLHYLEKTEMLLRGENPQPYEVSRTHRDGKIIHVLSSASPIKYAEGAIVGISVIMRNITALKRAEAERRRLAAIVESTSDAIISRDLNRTILTWNAAAEHLFGWAASEAIGRSAAMLVPPECEGENCRTRDLSETGTPVQNLETQRLRKDGSRVNVSLTQSPVFDETGKIVALSIIYRDITDRRKSEAMSARLAAIVESASDAIIGRTIDGIITSWNPAAEKLLGYAATEVLGKPITVLRAPAAKDYLERNNERLRCAQSVPAYHDRRMTKDGRIIDVMISASPIKDAAGKVDGVAVFYRDLTALRSIQAALIESEQRFQAAFDQAGVGIAIREIDPQNPRWLRVNRKLCEILGYMPQELLGLTSIDLTPPEDRREADDCNQRLSTGAVNSYVREKRYLRKNGTAVWVNLSLTAIRDEHGKPAYVLSVVEDVTEKKQAQEALILLNAELERRVADRTLHLEVANRELEAFSYSVSHDLRTPLRSIDGFSRLLAKHVQGLNPAGMDYLARIRRACARMEELIDDMLQLSRITRRQVRRSTVDVTAMARSILEEFRNREPKRSVDCLVADGLTVTADPALLRIALENLLGNAWKFTSKTASPRIEVSRGKHGGDNDICICDNGAGFDMKYADKIFGTFQRLHSADEFEGTGIGLAIVGRIMTLHSARIRAESEVGKGAAFFLSFRN